MNKFFSVLTISLLGMIFTSASFALEPSKVGIVNITQLFNNSAYVKKANTDLQKKVKQMEGDLQAQQKKLQGMVEEYNKASGNKKTQETKILAAQKKLKEDTEQFQQKIKAEQDAGMEKFSIQVRDAAAKVAKEKNLNGVLSSAAIVFADASWVDITTEVQAAMPSA